MMKAHADSPTVFISYRREDSAGHSGRLFDRFVNELGRDRVFRDVDNIRPGENFADVIRHKIRESDVLLVLIGPRWLTALNEEGRRRLEYSDDFVRLEIEMALESQMRVIPVLLPGTSLPTVTDLPDVLAPLVTFNAYDVTERHFDRDVLQLIAEIKGSRRARRFLHFTARTYAGMLIGVFASAIILLFWIQPESLMTAEQARDQLMRMGRTYDVPTFLNAASAGDVTTISLFLKAGMKPDATTLGNPPAIEYALDAGHQEIAKTLIEAGANVDRSLPWVAKSGNDELFQRLVRKKPSREGLSAALYQASENGHIKIVKELLDMGLSANDDWGGNPPLQAAVFGGRTDVVEFLLERGADVNAVSRGGYTALHVAARSQADNTPEIVWRLLGAGASVNVQNQDGDTPLMSAIGNRDIALMLLDSGANVKLVNNGGETALMYASGQHRTGMIKVLVDKGADINAKNKQGQTPLMWTSGAIDNVEAPETVQTIIDNGADVHVQDVDGWTALMYAASEGLNGTVRVLIGAGADRNKRNKDGQTALQLAIANSQKQTISILRK